MNRYTELTDRLFGAEGCWSLSQCKNIECGLIWADPMPVSEDIGKAYKNYYTHVASDPGRRGLLKNLYLKAKAAYLAVRFNYHRDSASITSRIFGKLLYLFPLRRGYVDESVRYLGRVEGGRLLDVGCGSGEWLRSMRELGWNVEGVDFDENAVRVARKNSLEVTVGDLESQHYPDASFDAVTLHHVIEHVPDPIKTLKECNRILKKGGKLVLFTPNVSSLSHSLFKQDWRGLETPRHLHLFSMRSIRQSLQIAGFRRLTLRPQIAFSVIYESMLIRQHQTGVFPPTRRHWRAWIVARFFILAELCLVQWKPSVADCLGAIAEKD